ncbi:hypothetical protein B0F90DRAFT_1814272 [Multifurca ochricompacta]|uniref:Uncharacterized protein n=1 Tax=Multifurca ochricompacta TaxID=376703 RepID=A0AAD4QRK0_9AGAM|nr:hypothetical protein B0F90DRAFT_1814272 [Multifurca ochricompacta]
MLGARGAGFPPVQGDFPFSEMVLGLQTKAWLFETSMKHNASEYPLSQTVSGLLLNYSTGAQAFTQVAPASLLLMMSSAEIGVTFACGPRGLIKIARFSVSAVMSIFYDYSTLENEDDQTLMEIRAFINCLSDAAVPDAYLVRLFPWIMHIPEREICNEEGAISCNTWECSTPFWTPFEVTLGPQLNPTVGAETIDTTFAW